MNKGELIAKIAEAGLSKKDAGIALDAAIAAIGDAPACLFAPGDWISAPAASVMSWPASAMREGTKVALPSDVGAVRALGFGADDYIDKAKSPEELLARVASALRRSRTAGTGAGKSAPAPRLGMLRIGSVSVNFAEMTAKGPGVSARLTKSDAVILNLLALRRGEIVAHDDIIAALHDGDCAGELAAVRAAVARLKERLGRAGACITTERGFGYRLLA